jgi:hypothetical protein
MTKKFTTSRFIKRGKIMKSHVLLGNFLDANLLNALVNLFDTNKNKDNINKKYINKITNYISNERIKRGLNDDNIKIESKLYDKNKKTSVILTIFKNNIKYMHLTIHLVPTSLTPVSSGVIHFYKNIYERKTDVDNHYKLYAIIEVKQPPGKPNSLEFTIADGYNTPKKYSKCYCI